MSGIRYLPLTNLTKHVIVDTVATALTVPVATVKFVNYTVVRDQNRRTLRQRFFVQQVYTVIAETSTAITLAAFPQFYSNSTTLFNYLNKLIIREQKSGNLTRLLSEYSVLLDNNQTMAVTVTHVVMIDEGSASFPTFSPTRTPHISRFIGVGGIMGIVSVVLLLLACCLFALYKRNLEKNYKIKRNAVYVDTSNHGADEEEGSSSERKHEPAAASDRRRLPESGYIVGSSALVPTLSPETAASKRAAAAAVSAKPRKKPSPVKTLAEQDINERLTSYKVFDRITVKRSPGRKPKRSPPQYRHDLPSSALDSSSAFSFTNLSDMNSTQGAAEGENEERETTTRSIVMNFDDADEVDVAASQDVPMPC